MPSPIKHQEIKEQLNKILSSHEFKASPRIRSLLTFIVEKTYREETAALTGAKIGEEVFGRRLGYDSQDDSIVRVQVRRLRRMLSLYYLTSGRFDPIHIDIPKGNYISTVVRNAVRYLPNSSPDEPKTPGKTSLTIIPFAVISSPEHDKKSLEAASLQLGLQDIFISTFLSNNKFSIFAYSRCNDEAAPKIERDIKTEFCLRGSIEYRGTTLRIIATLARVADKNILWSNSYEQAIQDPDDIFVFETAVATDVATQTADLPNIKRRSY